MGLIKKNSFTDEIGVRGFSKSGESFFFLMKTVGAVLPPPASFLAQMSLPLWECKVVFTDLVFSSYVAAIVGVQSRFLSGEKVSSS
jgi:hypothetical protein